MSAHPSGQPISPLRDPEIVIGLIAPLGTDLEGVVPVLNECLTRFGYRTELIHLSKLLNEIPLYEGELRQTKSSSEYDRISRHINAGTDLRRRTGRGDMLAHMAVKEIRYRRESFNKENVEGAKKWTEERRVQTPAPRTAYILRSLKHPDEVKMLRGIYGDGFFAISIYSPRDERISALAKRIARDASEPTGSKYEDQARALVKIDEAEEEPEGLGQDVGNAFPLADLFVADRDKTSLRHDVDRFLDAYFGYPFHTPSRDELGMFQAVSAALRSADLARQVGAVISTPEGDVVSIGCNDVPKAGGGLYWQEDDNDDRDFRRGFDSSTDYRESMISEIVDRFAKNDLLVGGKRSQIKAIRERLISGDLRSTFDDTRLANVIEYGRSVHAEMAALMSAAARGVPVKNCTLYTTTFPCHLCARHIIAAGISRVVYIEPYPKSAAADLYRDSMKVDAAELSPSKVTFQPFIGFAPRAYMHLFKSEGKRKTATGKKLDWSPLSAEPKFRRFVTSYIIIENFALTQTLQPKLTELKQAKNQGRRKK